MNRIPNLFDYATSELSQNVSIDYEISTIKVGRQWCKIDVWALINNEYFLVIEDKKGTTEHSNQLKRYAKTAREYII